ncbi:MAG: FKBP-type peptidyl-prolyl cis-trans isomerase [Lachnospiraceae bacterium]|nr:FKBP-type peptidyl-prolyl cis-trans isomerase [Lachnospiraceae bacterium]
MRIAVTYDNGEIFQHFGRTENFKIYEVEEGKVVSSEVVSANGAGHEALAGVLANRKVDVLICGGIGGGAQNALSGENIEICAGAEGDADKAVEDFLNGNLVNSGVNCHHHDGEHSCGHHDEGGCGGSCGSSCGGCHAPTIEGKNVGKTCRTHYIGTFNDGTQFDSSYDRGEPIEFVCGAGMMIRGFDMAVANMEVGEKVNIHLMPEEAYGESDPDAIFSVQIEAMPGSENLEVGQKIGLRTAWGQSLMAIVVQKDAETITFDTNHEMAGKELNFAIELVSVE